jgi:glucokinase
MPDVKNSQQTVIGVDLGGTNVRAGLVVDGAILQQATRQISSDASEDVVLEEIAETIQEVITAETTAVGIGVPSVVNVEAGVVYNVENIPSWQEVHLKRFLEDRFPVTVCVNNDVNCFVLGEHSFGQGRNHESIVGLALGTGLGGGIIIDNQLYAGASCGAGEFGMVPYRDHILEYYCSGEFFEKVHQTDGASVLSKAQQEDPAALAIFDEFGKHLGNAIILVLHTVDPELIILGGSVSNAFEFFEAAMRRQLQTFAFPKTIESLKIVRSTLPNVAVLGAASLCLSGCD